MYHVVLRARLRTENSRKCRDDNNLVNDSGVEASTVPLHSHPSHKDLLAQLAF